MIEKALNEHSKKHSNHDDDDDNDNGGNDNREPHETRREKTQSPIPISRKNTIPRIEDEETDVAIRSSADDGMNNDHNVKMLHLLILVRLMELTKVMAFSIHLIGRSVRRLFLWMKKS